MLTLTNLLLLLCRIQPTHEPTMESTQENWKEETIMFGEMEVKLGPGSFEGVMHHSDPLHKMGSILATVYKEHIGESTLEDILLLTSNVTESFIHEDGTVSIDAVALGEGSYLQDMVEELTSYGFQVDSTYRHLASGTIPISSLGEMCACSTLLMAMPMLAVSTSLENTPERRRRASGLVTSEGVLAMEVDKVLDDLGFNGTGVTVGVLSDSYDSLGGANNDILSGDLPEARW